LTKKFLKFLSKTLKFPEPEPLKEDNRQSGRVFQSGAHMTSNEVLAMYENIAALTGRMAAAARDGDWNGFAQLETQCALQAGAARTGVPALEGEQRKRKIDLLKQIMANDRAVRDVTEPWMGQLDRAMSPAH
jgi:flagellar protein FliT